MYSRIRNLREDRDLTQKQMGEILNCSQRIYSNYECGDVDIPTQILIKLAKFHKTSVDYLLGLTDEKRPYPRKKTPVNSFCPVPSSGQLSFPFLSLKSCPQSPMLHPHFLPVPYPPIHERKRKLCFLEKMSVQYHLLL